MIKKINVIFFAICFLAALLTELYCIQVLNGDLFTVVGLGIVVLVTGYLMMDSIRDIWRKNNDNTVFFIEKMIQEEAEKWNERYTDLMNLQKATYSATKKNSVAQQERIDHLLTKLEENETTMKRILELQKKSLEGQKNALNFEINHNNENTKLIIKSMTEKFEKLHRDDQWNDQMSDQLSVILQILQNISFLEAHNPSEVHKQENNKQLLWNDSYENIPEAANTVADLPFTGTVDDFNEAEAGEEGNTVHKAQTYETADRDQNAQAYETADKDQNAQTYETADKDQNAQTYETADRNQNAQAYETADTVHEVEAYEADDTVHDSEVYEAADTVHDATLDEILKRSEVIDSNVMPEVTEQPNEIDELTTMDAYTEIIEQNVSDQFMAASELVEAVHPEVIPLYDDPNKKLSADEIASLFASFGR
jgi:hypothetical protein